MVDYKKKADIAWSKLIRQKGYCEAQELGNCKGNLQAAHIIRRGSGSTRCDPDNGLCLCVSHHYWFDKVGDKFIVTEWFKKKWPGRWERLHDKNVIVHYKSFDWQRIYEDLTKLNNNLE